MARMIAWPSTLALERRAALLAVVAANAVSQLGNVVAVVALPWFVLVTTGSPARAGVTAFAATLPLAAGALLGGALVERLGLRTASVLADLGAAAAIAGIPLSHSLGALSFELLLVLAFLGAACEGPGRAARRAMMPSLADGADMTLERANAVSTTSEHIGYVLGAPLAGGLIALLGAPGALWVDAGSFVVSALLVASTRVRPAADEERARLRDGVRFVWRQPLLRTFFTIWTIGGFVIAPLAAVVLPVYAKEELGGAGSLAACVTAYGVGGLVGTLAYGVVGIRMPRRRFFVATWVVYPAVAFALVPVPPLAAAVAILLVIGVLVGAYDPFEVTVQQELIPPSLRARAFAILISAEMLVVPPAMLLYGVLIEAFGLRAGLLLYAAGNVLLGCFAIASRPARAL
jgi:MFS family permease